MQNQTNTGWMFRKPSYLFLPFGKLRMNMVDDRVNVGFKTCFAETEKLLQVKNPAETHEQ